uniref:Alpha-(1,6)-fucosyltransferase (Trinotate prediction) n=1 Tax=Myxobolus squamalis TaxID=59785 RepID=A0A6B2G5C8_MYXSQ
MFWVELYFRKIEIKGKQLKRVVYLATDEIGIVRELKKKYPHYEFITNEKSTLIANTKRGSKEGTYGIFSDIYYLSECDYLVCTFSSNVCRLAYEWMNGKNSNKSESFKSIDSIYYYDRQLNRQFVVLEPQKSLNSKNISSKFIVVDDFHYFNNVNHWNGYSYYLNLVNGKIIRTRTPSYKLKETMYHYPFKAFTQYENSKL